MGCLSTTLKEPTTWNLEGFALADATTVTPNVNMPPVSLPHLAVAGQRIKISNNIAIGDISDKIPHILDWLAFCDHHSLLLENEKEMLNAPSQGIHHLYITEKIVQTTFSRFNEHLSDTWQEESKRLMSMGITADNFSEESLCRGASLKLEFEINDTEYGGNEALGLRLVDESNPTVFLMNTTRVNQHLARYLNGVINKLTEMSGQAIGEIILGDYHFFGEYADIIKDLPLPKKRALKALIKTTYHNNINFDDPIEGTKIIKAINAIIDETIDTIDQREIEDIESIVNEIEETVDFSERKDAVQADLALDIMTVKRMANKHISRRNKPEVKILKVVNAIVEAVLLPRKESYVAASFGEGSDESFFLYHHVYVSNDNAIYNTIDQFFHCNEQQGEIPAYWIDLKKKNAVIKDLIAYQQGYFCLSALDELMSQLFKK